jgi:signal peptidase II
MKKRYLIPSAVAAVTLMDQVTKYFADTLVEPARPQAVLPFFNLVNVKNTGAAFGILDSMGNWFFVVLSIAAACFVVYLLIQGRDGYFSLTLILSGALGNLMDRLFLGHVRDFLDFHIAGHHWPAFNVADSALTVGLLALLGGTFLKKKPDGLKKKPDSPGSQESPGP